MKMKRGDTFQIHANVNSQQGDSALRVTISVYDEVGDLTFTQTWRKHVRTLWFDDARWQAYSGIGDLSKLMAIVCTSGELVEDEPDEPLF